MKKLFSSIAFPIATLITFGSLTAGADGAIYILDSTNGYEVTVASSFTIDQESYERSIGEISFTGATAALGSSDVADFTSGTFTTIGNTSKPGGNTPINFASNAVAFTLRDNTSLQLYDAVITYYKGADRGKIGGIAPDPNNSAGLVIEVNAASAVPEPTSLFLLSFGSLAIVIRRRRNQ